MSGNKEEDFASIAMQGENSLVLTETGTNIETPLIDQDAPLKENSDDENWRNREDRGQPKPQKLSIDSVKEERLKLIRNQMVKRQEMQSFKQEKKQAITRGKEFYLQKVTNFLITSFCLNLAIELIFTYSLLHDYINSYLNNQASIGIFEGNNWCFLLFYSFRTIGYWLSAFYFSHKIQKDVKLLLM